MTKNVRENFIDWNIEQHIDKKTHDMLWKSHCRKGQVLITMAGEYLGRIAVYNSDEVISSNQAIAKITLKSGYNPYLISTFLNTKHGQNQIQRLKTITGQPNINMSLIKSLKIPDFSISFSVAIEQLICKSENIRSRSYIAYDSAETLFLKTLNFTNFAPNTEKVNIKSFKDSFAKTGRLDAEYYQRKYEIIEEMVKKSNLGYDKIGNIAKLKNGSFIPDAFYTSAKGRPYLRIKELSFNQPINTNDIVFISDEFKTLNETKVKENDFVIATIGNTIGKINLITREINGAFISNNTSKLTLSISTNNYYFYEVMFRSFIFQEQIQKEFTQTAQPKISNNSIENIIVPKIELVVQNKINALAQESFNLKAESERLLDAAKKAVEIAIEQDEQTAIKFLTEETGENLS